MSEWKQLNFFNKYLTDIIFGSFDAYPYGYEYDCFCGISDVWLLTSLVCDVSYIIMNVHLELLTYLFVCVLGVLHWMVPLPFWLKVDIHLGFEIFTLPPQSLLLAVFVFHSIAHRRCNVHSPLYLRFPFHSSNVQHSTFASEPAISNGIRQHPSIRQFNPIHHERISWSSFSAIETRW